MNDVLSKLYYGEISPCSQPTPDTIRYKENKTLIMRLEEKLLDSYPDCSELLNQYTDALHISAQLESEADFERGFKLGAAFMLETLNK